MTDWNSNHIEALLERLVLAAEAIAARLPLPAVTSTPADSAPQPDADDWIEWHGGDCPVPAGTVVDIILLGQDTWLGCEASILSRDVNWWKERADSKPGPTITAYRITAK